MIGTTISHYKIVEKLGEGGMGVVYKAHDTKLDRIVALKFMPKHVGADETEKKRFINEAQAASTLDHPNICTIYSIEESDDGNIFIVMAYYEGTSLKEKIDKGPLPLQEIVDYSIQIADGLQKAHEKGIIHRDLKPANVFITDEGKIKIIDFGLAKAAERSMMTKTGTTLGTVPYMSPEQAQGQKVDRRTDIWSFGVIMYEMITGQLPFRNDYDTALVYSIINEDPEPVTGIRTGVPIALENIVFKCLEKNPADRYQHADDISVDLRRTEKVKTNFTERASQKRSSITSRRPVIKGAVFTSPVIIAALLFFLLGFILGIQFSGSRDMRFSPVTTRLAQVTFSPGLGDEPTWSPDGRFLAFTTDEQGKLDIVVQPLGEGEPIRVVDSEADDAQPAWSPDGTRIAFVSARDHGGRLAILLGMDFLQEYIKARNGDIFIVPATGGSPVKLIDNGYYPSWSPDGEKIVFQSNRDGSMQLWVIPAEGGIPIQLTDMDDIPYHPSWSPDGNWIVFGVRQPTHFSMYVMPADGGEPIKFLDEPVIRPSWSADGRHIIYSTRKDGIINIWKVEFHGENQPRTVLPARITLSQGHDVNSSPHPLKHTLAYTSQQSQTNIWELSLDRRQLRQITSTTTNENRAHPSPDGRSILLTSNRGGMERIWIYDLEEETYTHFQTGKLRPLFGMWSPDGQDIVYITENDDREYQIRLQRVGDLTAREIMSGPEFVIFPVWSPDGRTITFGMIDEHEIFNMWIYSIDDDKLRQLTFLDSHSYYGSFSPDGSHVVFSVTESQTRTLWKAPVDGGDVVQLTFGEVEHSHPMWSPVDPDIILFLEDHQSICLLRVSTGEIERIQEFHESTTTIDYPSWSSDGSKIYFTKDEKFGDIFVLEDY